MKVRIASSTEISSQDLENAEIASELGMTRIATPEEFRDTLRETTEIVLAKHVVESLAEEGITPDEFVAMLLNSVKATH